MYRRNKNRGHRWEAVKDLLSISVKNLARLSSVQPLTKFLDTVDTTF